MTRLRLLFSISILALLAAGLVACGGSNGGGGEDPNTVLNQTFSSSTQTVKSGDLNLTLHINGSATQPFKIDFIQSGPFEIGSNGKPAKSDSSVKINSSGAGKDTNFDGGLISTGGQAFVTYKGSAYQAPPALLNRLKSVTQAQGALQGQNQSARQLLDLLGIKDPKSLLTNLKNEGDADVEGTSTVHISGDLDVNRTIDAAKTAVQGLGAIGALGGNASQLPTASQLDQFKGAVKTAHFDLYSGQDDHILRRLTIALSVAPPSGSLKNVDVALDYTIGKVNEPQAINPPANPKPFSELLKQLGGTTGVDSLGSLGLGAGSGSASGGGTAPVVPSGGGGSNQQTQKYLDCISKASSAAEIQSCNSLLPSG